MGEGENRAVVERLWKALGAASFFHFRAGKIVHLTEYWVEGRSREPYESRRRHVERM